MGLESLPEKVLGLTEGFGELDGLESLPEKVLGMTEGFGELDGVGVPT